MFFAVSLAPSLLPRPVSVQGILSGLSLAAGYGLGALGVWLWRYLQLPAPSPRWRRSLGLCSAVLCGVVVLFFLWQAGRWQNNIRALLDMEPAHGTRAYLLGSIAALIFGALLVAARLFRHVLCILSRRLQRYLPRRVALILGFFLVFALFWTIVNGVLVRSALRVANRSFQQLDAWIDDDIEMPAHAALRDGQPPVLAWKDLGRQGRLFVAKGPNAEELSAFFTADTPAPVRVYVGLNAADTPEERAQLALDELIRAGGFERSILLLATPTGTGWIDPAALDTVEYLHRGDIATVAAQYSYLNSPLALLTEAAYGAEMADALFRKIYGYWRSLPRGERPRLYLHGLSLGAFHSDRSFNIFDIIDDPFDGALWSGPPFRTETWRRMTSQRTANSPAWLPLFRDGSVVRFMNQFDMQAGDVAWGDFRIVFLQYGSDPIVFFNPAAAWREPSWMRSPRAPDVTPDLRWFPIVTMLQLAADMIVGTAPTGFGHQYAAADYIDAWLALTEPPDWPPSEVERLKEVFAVAGTRAPP